MADTTVTVNNPNYIPNRPNTMKSDYGMDKLNRSNEFNPAMSVQPQGADRLTGVAISGGAN